MKLDWKRLEVNEPCRFSSISPPPYFELFAVDFDKWTAVHVDNLTVREEEALALAGVNNRKLVAELLDSAIPTGFNGEKAVFLYREENIHFDSDPCKVSKPQDEMELYYQAERVVDYYAAFVVVGDEETAQRLQELVREHGANVAVLNGWEGLYRHIKDMLEWFFA